MSVKVIVFDFDGTIVLGSEALKRQAWRELFPNCDELIVEAHRQFSGRGSRHDIIRFLLSGNGHTKDENTIQKYLEKFDALVQQGIEDEGITDAARIALKKLSEKFPLYLSTATPEDAIGITLKRLGIESFFKKIFGWPTGHNKPTTKVEHLMKILNLENVGPDEIVLVGDGEKDRQSAQTFGCKFIGIASQLNGWREFNEEFPVAPDISQVSDKLLLFT